MSLRMALLALLTTQPMTGYDLSRQFSSSVGNVWHAADSQIYPELRRMHREGLLHAESVPWGSKGATKTQYLITEDGKAALRSWQDTVQPYTPDRDPARLKAAYFEWADPAAVTAQLRAHIQHFETELAHAEQQLEAISSREQPTIARRLDHYPAPDHDRIIAFKIFAYEGKRDQARQEIAWAKRGLKLVEQLGQGRVEV
ncbi:MAG: PadR family transcriptional regulator [Micrococcaceae bacterium]